MKIKTSLCYPVGHTVSHFSLHSFESARKVTEIFSFLSAIVFVGYVYYDNIQNLVICAIAKIPPDPISELRQCHVSNTSTFERYWSVLL